MEEVSQESYSGLGEERRGRFVDIDSALYHDDIIFRVCHLFTDRCVVSLDRLDEQHVRVRFDSRGGADNGDIIGEFYNELINQRVRSDVIAETRAIRDLIVAQAFVEADSSIVAAQKVPNDAPGS